MTNWFGSIAGFLLNDAQFNKLPESLQLLYVKLCAIAALHAVGGTIKRPLPDIAWMLHMEDDELLQALGQLEDIGLLANTPEGLEMTRFHELCQEDDDWQAVPGRHVATYQLTDQTQDGEPLLQRVWGEPQAEHPESQDQQQPWNQVGGISVDELPQDSIPHGKTGGRTWPSSSEGVK